MPLLEHACRGQSAMIQNAHKKAKTLSQTVQHAYHLWCLTMQLTGTEQCPKTCNKTVLMVVSGTHSLQAAAVMAGLHRTYVDSVSQFMFVVLDGPWWELHPCNANVI